MTTHIPYEAVAPVGCKDYNGGDGALERSVEVSETLDVKHVDLVYKQHPRDQLSHPLVNVPVHHFVDLSTELIWEERANQAPGIRSGSQV